LDLGVLEISAPSLICLKAGPVFRAIFWAGAYLNVEERGAYSDNATLPCHYPTLNKLDGNLQKHNHVSR
jgi:hypothetical protein